MKICTSCKIPKEKDEFNKNKSKSDGYNNICKLCSRERSRLYYKDNPLTHLAAVKKRNERVVKENTEYILEVKQSGCCCCDEDHPVCLDFHHIDPTTKENNIALMYKLPLESIKREIAKCVVICSNCHRKLHAGIIELPELAKM